MRNKEIMEMFKDKENSCFLKDFLCGNDSKYLVEKVEEGECCYTSDGDDWGIADENTYSIESMSRTFVHGFCKKY